MKILVTEKASGDGVDASRRLTAFGHEVVRCHDPADSTDAVCLALRPGGRCPLKEHRVGAVLGVRGTGGPVTAWESGMLCALRSGTPLVVCGEADRHVAPWNRADRWCGPEEVVTACERAASPASATVHRELARAVRRVLASHRADPRASILVAERGEVASVFVTTARPVGGEARSDIRAEVRLVLAPYTRVSPFTQVVFLTRERA
jgi:hypothetical protein